MSKKASKSDESKMSVMEGSGSPSKARMEGDDDESEPPSRSESRKGDMTDESEMDVSLSEDEEGWIELESGNSSRARTADSQSVSGKSTTSGKSKSDSGGSDSGTSGSGKKGKFKKRDKKSRSLLDETDGEGGSDFGQEELRKEQQAEAELKAKRASWTGDPDDEEDEDEGGAKDLIGRSEKKAAGGDEGKDTEDKKRRKRKRKKSLPPKEEKVTKVIKKAPEEEEVEEDEEEEEFVQEEEKVWVEPVYKAEDFVSGSISTPESTVPEKVIRFFYSYGYDTHRRNNIQVLDEENIVYICGNYLHFYSLVDNKLILIRRSASGYGIGHVAVHPSRQYFAVGEKGHFPYIMIYTWPELLVHRVLRRGTTKGYAYVNFNPTGEMLCSVGQAPDYMLTIWDWNHEKIILRYKAFSQDVYRATFSPTNPGDLCTSGLGHIRFWKMAYTFTGLKLQGLIGRFGKTEISDIFCYNGLSDGKVISGSEWGNLLIWDGGLIACEVGQKQGKNCHAGEVTDLVHQDTELVTIGGDGFMRLWETEQLDLASTGADDSGKCELEPMFEFKLASTAKLLTCVRGISEEANVWFIQDAWGKVWSVNLSLAMTSTEYMAETLFYAPGGAVNGIGISPLYTVMLIGTEGGHLWGLDYISKDCLVRKVYATPITRIIWLTPKYDPNGLTFLVAFGDGTVRLMRLNLLTEEEIHAEVIETEHEEEALPYEFYFVQHLRYHKGRVLVMKIDEDKDILYTCGADKVIFGSSIFWDDEKELTVIEPLSYVTAPFPVISLDLHPIKDYRMLIASRSGRVAECRRPIWGDMDTSVTYNQGKLHGRRWGFKSVKSNRRREEHREARKKEREEKLDELYKDIQKRRESGIMVDEDLEVGRLNDKYRRQQALEDEEEIYTPEKPCPVLAIYYHINKALAQPETGKTFFMHIGEYDAGYIYECRYNRPTAGGFHPVPPTPPFEEDVAVKCYILSADNEYLLFGMTDGTIRVMPRAYPPKIVVDKTKKEKKRKKKSSSDDESAGNSDSDDAEKKKKASGKALPPFPTSFYPYDLQNFWTVPMHDPDRGAVNALAWSADNQFLFSVGDDGSIFSYRWDAAGRLSTATDQLKASFLPDTRFEEPSLVDTEDPNAYTLEELKKKAEADRLLALADAKKEIIRKELRRLKMDFRALVQRNEDIPEQFRVPRVQFELDRRIKEPRKQRNQEEIEEVYRKSERDGARSVVACRKIESFFLDRTETPHIVIKDFEHTVQVHTFRHRILTPEFLELFEKNKGWMIDEELLLNAIAAPPPPPAGATPVPVKRYYAKDLIGDFEGKTYDVKTIQAIRTLEERLSKRYVRECEWSQLNAQHVPDDYEAPEDVAGIKWASENMGDYKLKTSDDFLGEKITTAARRQRVMNLKKWIHERVSNFNVYVRNLQIEKMELIKKCKEIEAKIKDLHKLIPGEMRRPIPPIHDMEDIEDPEKLFHISEKDIEIRQAKKLEAAGLAKRKKMVEDQMRNSSAEKSDGNQETKKTKRVIHKEGDFRRGRNDPKAPVAELKKPAPPSQLMGQQYFKVFGKSSAMEGLSVAVWKYRKSFFTPTNEATTKRKERVLTQRRLQRDELLLKLKGLISYFKERVSDVRNERVDLQLDIKLMSIAILVLIQELDIVKEFDSAEKAVLERLKAQKAECATAKDKLEKVRKRLNRAKTDQERVEEGIGRIQKEVSNVIGDKGRFADYLWRVYKKKIKIVTQEEDEADARHHSSSSSEGSSNSTSVDSNSDLFKLPKQKFNLNICPDQLDRGTYNRVCDFRQRRARMEMDLEGQKRVVEKIARDFNEVERVFERFSGRLDGIGHEVNVLQRKKQIRMNELKNLVILKSDQIQCLEETDVDRSRGSIIERLKNNFPNISDVIVFPKDGTAKLDLRIEELKEEITQEKDKQQRARHMLVRLREELHKKEDHVKILDAECKKDMTAKFGRVVDLDELCACIINLKILDALLVLESRRNRHYAERDRLAKRIEETRWSLTDVTKVNSEYNTLLAILEERQRDVDYFLYKQNKTGTSQVAYEQSESREFDKDNQDVMEEMYMLEDRLVNQEGKISYLREIITTGRTKYGIPPIVPLTCIPDNIGSQFMTYQELQEYRDWMNMEVETLYMRDNITNRLLSSESQVPFMGESVSRVPSEPPVEEEGEDYDGELETLGGQKGNLVPADLSPGEETFGEDEEEEEDDYPYFPGAYPINVIPDDQMPQTDPETDYNTEEEGYMSDPIPVAKTEVTGEKTGTDEEKKISGVGPEATEGEEPRKTSNAEPEATDGTEPSKASTVEPGQTETEEEDATETEVEEEAEDEDGLEELDELLLEEEE